MMRHTGYRWPGHRPGWRHRERPAQEPGGRRRRAPRLMATAALAAVAAAGSLSGCSAQRPTGPAIQIAAAYVTVPRSGSTVAYVVIRNNGGPDSLVSARTSVGGRVAFHGPDAPGVVSAHTVPAIPIPAHAMLAMVPDGFYMMISGAGPMHGGGDITLTLVFARAGPVAVIAQVTNPATGGSSYFLN